VYAGDVVGGKEPGHTRYRCFVDADDVAPGATVTVVLRVRVLSARPGVGSVRVAGGTYDPVAGNNVAPIQVNRPSGSSGGSGGAAGLPITGAPTAPLVLVGLATAAFGALLIALAGVCGTTGRRRSRTSGG
jgi:hypothetical protein